MAAARKRYHALAVKEALETITHKERAKLERYQVLVMAKPSAAERSASARQSWRLRQALKALRDGLRRAANSPVSV